MTLLALDTYAPDFPRCGPVCPVCERAAQEVGRGAWMVHPACERAAAQAETIRLLRGRREGTIPPAPEPVYERPAPRASDEIADPGEASDWSRPAEVGGPLCIAGTSKWLIVAPLRPDMVIDHKVVVICLPTWRAFALLSSVVHAAWARFAGLHSTMQATARYTSSRIFESFPFPRPDAAGRAALDAAGVEFHAARSEAQRRMRLGLTKLYNRIADPGEGCPWAQDLRRALYMLDRLVLDAYGWHDLTPPCWTDMPTCIEAAVEMDRPVPPVIGEIVRRLRRLNARRAREQA